MKSTSMLSGAVYMILMIIAASLVYLGMSFVFQTFNLETWPALGRLILVVFGIPAGLLGWFISFIWLNSPKRQLKNITKENQKNIMKKINPYHQEGKIKGNIKVYEEELARPTSPPKPMRPPAENSKNVPSVFINFDWSNARPLENLEAAAWPPAEPLFGEPPPPPPDRVIKEGGPVRPPKGYGELK